MGWPTHIVAAGGYVFDKNGKVLGFKNQIIYASYVTKPEFRVLKERFI